MPIHKNNYLGTVPVHIPPVKAAGELFAANLCAEMVELCAAELAALVPPAGPLLLAPLLTPAPGHAQQQQEKVAESDEKIVSQVNIYVELHNPCKYILIGSIRYSNGSLLIIS